MSETRIPWGLPGPSDPVDRAFAHNLNADNQ
jgi:hypothetical protein